MPWPYTFPFRFDDKKDSRYKETSTYDDVENRSGLDTEYDNGTQEKSPLSSYSSVVNRSGHPATYPDI